MTREKAIGLVVVVLLGGWLVGPVSGQDITTQLAFFLRDMRNGTWGQTQTATTVTLTDNDIAETSTDAVIVTNTTAATSGATVQMSPRVRWRGNAWDTAASQTVDFFAENLPASAATPTGTWRLGYSLNGGATATPLTVSSIGAVTSAGTITSGGGFVTAASSANWWTGRTSQDSPANGLLNITNLAQSVGVQVNTGTAAPTVTACGSGAVTTGSRNQVGEITNVNTSCTVTFGAPAWTNAPFCVATDKNKAIAVSTATTSTTAVTFVGPDTGDGIQYLCMGRI